MITDEEIINGCSDICKSTDFLRKHVWKVHIKDALNDKLLRYKLNENEEVIGFLILKRLKNKYGGAVKLKSAGISPKYKKQGIYTLLIKEAMNEFSNETLIGEVREDNPIPHRVLRKLGFGMYKTKYIGKSKDIKVSIYIMESKK